MFIIMLVDSLTLSAEAIFLKNFHCSEIPLTVGSFTIKLADFCFFRGLYILVATEYLHLQQSQMRGHSLF